jgi:hypothetical protein
MKKLILLISLIFLTGCDPIEFDSNSADQCLRQKIFERCLELTPSNCTDCGDLVNECNNAAYYQSLRLKEFIKPECRGK